MELKSSLQSIQHLTRAWTCLGVGEKKMLHGLAKDLFFDGSREEPKHAQSE